MASSSTKESTKRAMTLLLILLILGFGSCIIYLGYVQLIKGDTYRAKAETSQLYDSEISAERGVIYDRNMKELAKSASAWKVVIYPNKLKDEAVREQIVDSLSKIIVEKDEQGQYTKEDLEETKESVREKASMTSYGYLVVKNKIEKELRDEIIKLMETKINVGAEMISLSNYIGIESDVKRYYPYGTFASTVIGFTGTEDIGRAGLELRYNSDLTGTNGRIITAVNGGANNDKMPVEFETVYDAEQGTSLVTTLDETIQRYLEESLSQALLDHSAKSAYGIVMDVNTGAILAMSSQPDYDSNNPYKITDTKTIEVLEEISDKEELTEKKVEAQYSQWRNRTISDTYEPGSVSKIITAAAALEENIWPENDTFSCIGHIEVEDRIIRCSHTEGHGAQTFKQAFANSCNPFFIRLGLDMGQEIFFKYFEAFGLTESTGIDLPAEASPVKDVTYHSLENMSVVNLASSSFGQTFQVSPIQMLTAVSAIANGGNLMKPYIVSKMLNQDGEVIKQNNPVVKRQVVSESTCDKIIEMMEEVVNSGTGANGYVAGYRVAGKTGTSEKIGANNGKYVASFVCFAPADDPQVAILIAVDEPEGQYYGSQVAAPVAAIVMQKIMTYLNVEPQFNEDEEIFTEVNAINVVGKDVSSAKALLKDEGFNVRVMGNGESVIEQVPSANQTISKNGTVILYTEKSTEKETTTVPSLIGYGVSEIYSVASYYGINVKIVGNGYDTTGFVSYKQSVESGTEVAYGSTVTVYFKSNLTAVD